MYILCTVALVLALIGWIPLGVAANLDGSGASLRLRIGPLRPITIFPTQPKEKKSSAPEEPAEKEKPKRKKKGKASRTGIGFGPGDLPELLGLGLDVLGRIRRTTRVEELTLHLVFAAGNDPNAVLLYGYTNAALAAIGPALHRAVRVRREDVQTAVDFYLDRTIYEFRLAATLRIGQIVGIVLAGGWAAVHWLLRRKQRHNS